MRNRSIPETISSKDLGFVMNRSVKQVKDMVQYDHVMIYRFDKDGSGEVLAEAKDEHLRPLIGQQYPVSDMLNKPGNCTGLT